MVENIAQAPEVAGDGLEEVMAGFDRPPVPEPDDGVDYEGVQILVTWGKEHIQPSRFQGMDIGPFAMTVPVLKGETPLRTKRRVMRQLNAMAEEELNEKTPRFIQRCKAIGRN